MSEKPISCSAVDRALGVIALLAGSEKQKKKVPSVNSGATLC